MRKTPASPSAVEATAECYGSLAALESLTPEVFEPHVGEIFRARYQQFENARTHVQPLHVGSQRDATAFVELKLVEVTRYPQLKEREGGFDYRPREPFALLFEGPSDPTLISAEHTIHHAQLGAGRLFLNPVQAALRPPAESPSDVRFYETTFS